MTSAHVNVFLLIKPGLSNIKKKRYDSFGLFGMSLSRRESATFCRTVLQNPGTQRSHDFRENIIPWDVNPNSEEQKAAKSE